jgi:hypothetical protein
MPCRVRASISVTSIWDKQPANSRVISILGGKIDNIYDLFDLVRRTGPDFAGATTRALFADSVCHE